MATPAPLLSNGIGRFGIGSTECGSGRATNAPAQLVSVLTGITATWGAAPSGPAYSRAAAVTAHTVHCRRPHIGLRRSG